MLRTGLSLHGDVYLQVETAAPTVLTLLQLHSPNRHYLLCC